MDLQRALRELGLAGAPSPEQVRRAYLRQVRIHSPERDPEGFKRVRSAYDRLRAKSWRFEGEVPDGALANAFEGMALRVEMMGRAEEASAVEDRESRATGTDVAVLVERRPVDAFSELNAAPEKYSEFEAARARGDVEGAAALLVELYEKPELAAQAPSAVTCFDFVLASIEEKRPVGTRAVLDAFEAYALRDGVRLDANMAAIWRLVRELMRLVPLFEPRVCRALSRGIHSGDMLAAARAIRLGRATLSSIERTMSERAPTLWAMVQPHMDFERAAPSSHREWGWRAGWIPWGVLLLGLNGLVRTCAGADGTRVQRDAVVVPFESPARDVLARHALILQAIEGGDCVGVREHWPIYSAEIVREGRRQASRLAQQALRERGLKMCPELEQELDEVK